MAFLANEVLDAALNLIDTSCENLYICSAEPTTFTQASSTNKLGTKATPTISVSADRAAGGREITISAVTDGVVDSTGDASHWALTDDSATLLLATGSLSSTQTVTATNTFTLTEFKIGIADPA
jgi:hypothetical protein